MGTKHTEEKRNARLNIPMTEKEKERIKNIIPISEYSSVSQFARETLLMVVDILEKSNSRLVFIRVEDLDK